MKDPCPTANAALLTLNTPKSASTTFPPTPLSSKLPLRSSSTSVPPSQPLTISAGILSNNKSNTFNPSILTPSSSELRAATVKRINPCELPSSVSVGNCSKMYFKSAML